MALNSKASASLVATPDHVLHAFDSVIHHLSSEDLALPEPPFDNVSCPLFVTWNKASKHGDVKLRGCIGTFEARNLHTSLKEYALISALKDRRFEPITLSELPQLRCTVSLLHSFEPGTSWDDWEIGTHGITIEFTDPQTYTHRSATFLPEIAAHEKWNKTTTLEHLVRKSGCTAGAGAVLKKIKLTRYQSALCTLSYDEYLQRKEPRLFRVEKGRERRAEEAITVPA